MTLVRALVLATAMPCGIALAQKGVSKPEVTVNAGLSASRLDHDLGRWHGAYVRASHVAGPSAWHLDVTRRCEFGDCGVSASLGQVRELNRDWIASGFITTSVKGFFLPRLKLDASIARKVLPNRSLVLTLGGGLIRAKDGHRDGSVLLDATWYATSKWVFDSGVRLNRSHPGNVDGTRKHFSATWGRTGYRYLTGRIEAGDEAYQLIGPDTTIADFKSRTTSLTWREWLTRDYGLVLGAEQYRSPGYRRRGVDAAFFMVF